MATSTQSNVNTCKKVKTAKLENSSFSAGRAGGGGRDDEAENDEEAEAAEDEEEATEHKAEQEEEEDEEGQVEEAEVKIKKSLTNHKRNQTGYLPSQEFKRQIVKLRNKSRH
jgi:hypothetical protein